MSIAFICVFLAALLPYPFTLAAKLSRRFDNARPREYLEALSGWRQHAHWTQLNSFEAFPPFAAAVIIHQLVLGPSLLADRLAMAFIALRLLYGLCYLADQALLRSLAWFAACLCPLTLFVHAI